MSDMFLVCLTGSISNIVFLVGNLSFNEICMIEILAVTIHPRICLGETPYFRLNIRLKLDRFVNPHFCEISKTESLVEMSMDRASVTRKSFT